MTPNQTLHKMQKYNKIGRLIIKIKMKPSFQLGNIVHLRLIVLHKLRKQERKRTQTHLQPNQTKKKKKTQSIK